MRQSTLAIVCGIALIVILAYSWCGRNPPEQTRAFSPTPTPTSAPAAPSPTIAVTVVTSPSVSVAPTTTTPPAQTPPPEFQKVAQKAEPAIVQLTLFDAKGQLLRSGNAFFVSRDGLLATSWEMVANAAYGVAKSSDGKIRNVTGLIAWSKESGLAILRAETKVGVSFLPLQKTSESIAVNAWGVVIGSTLQHKEQPMAGGMIASRGADPKKDPFQIGGTIPSDSAGAPVVDANGEVVGIVTAGGKNEIQPSGQVEHILAQIKPGMTGRWGATPAESPTATPTPRFARPRVISNPAPRYPYEARTLRSGPTTGSGKFRVTFGTNGSVKNVQTVESTGQTILDQAAIKALQNWKAEPGAQDWTVLVPITFQP